MRTAYNFWLILATFTSISLGAQAQDSTPSHVFQVTQTILAELDLIHAANESSPVQEVARPELRDLRPRHVMQNARTAFRMVQTLKELNNLAVEILPNLPEQEVTPAEVRNIPDTLLVNVRDLKAAFFVSETIQEAPFVEGKVPTDVYNAFSDIRNSLMTLGIPRIVPNDVYQRAKNILNAVNQMAVNQALIPSVPVMITVKTSPTEVYGKGFEIYGVLADLAFSQPDAAPPGGLATIFRREEGITPAHVLELLGFVLADLHAMAVLKGLDTNLETAAFEGGKGPGDVMDVLLAAHEAVLKL